jgi:hypothetical protein
MFDNISDSDFEEVVIRESKGEAPPAITAELQKPENLDRWRSALVSILQRTQNQLTGLRADHENDMAEARENGADKAERARIEAEFQQRRRDTGAFRGHIERRLREVKRVIAADRHGRYVDLVQDERDAFRAALEQIATAPAPGQHSQLCVCPIHVARKALGYEWVMEKDAEISA